MRRGASASAVALGAVKPPPKLAEKVSSSIRESRAAAASASANGVACSNRACTAGDAMPSLVARSLRISSGRSAALGARASTST